MSVLVDTSILIDYPRGDDRTREVLERERTAGVLSASEMLAGIRSREETRLGACCRLWRGIRRRRGGGESRRAGSDLPAEPPSHRRAGQAIAAAAMVLGARLLTLNVRPFPMFPDLRRPY